MRQQPSSGPSFGGPMAQPPAGANPIFPNAAPIAPVSAPAPPASPPPVGAGLSAMQDATAPVGGLNGPPMPPVRPSVPMPTPRPDDLGPSGSMTPMQLAGANQPMQLGDQGAPQPTGGLVNPPSSQIGPGSWLGDVAGRIGKMAAPNSIVGKIYSMANPGPAPASGSPPAHTQGLLPNLWGALFPPNGTA